MRNLGLTVLLTTLTTCVALGACGSDPSGTDQTAGGAGGADENEAGRPSAGKSTGGSNSNAGSGGSSAGEPAAAGAAGEASGQGGGGGEPALVGGAGGESAGGAGGGGSDVVYQCNDTTQSHKLCSAFKAAACTPATDCADCVTTRNSEHEPFEDCASCQAEYDAFEQCGIDAFESGNITTGIECVPDFGADLQFENCYPLLDGAVSCLNYTLENPCPATWPVQ